MSCSHIAIPISRWRTAAAFCMLMASFSAYADILIGQTTAVTGPVAASVGETLLGVHAYLDHVNAQGGVNGEKIKLVTLDDNFKPAQALANARQLIEQDKVVALFMSRATPHTQAILPLLPQYRIALIAPSTGAMVFHKPVNPYVFNVRSSYQAESQRAIEHLFQVSLERVAVVHVDDSFGADCLAGAMKGFESAGKQPAAVIKVDRETPDYGAVIQTLKNVKAQAVLWIGSSVAVSDGVKAIRKAGIIAQVVTVSNNASSGFIKQLGEYAHGVIVSQVFPNVRALGVPINREATELLKGKGELTPQVMEGFASAKVLVEALRRAGPKPTREKIIDALNGMQRFDLGGLELGYSPSNHTGLRYVELSIIGSDGRFRR